jgi:hypothetical protein
MSRNTNRSSGHRKQKQSAEANLTCRSSFFGSDFCAHMTQAAISAQWQGCVQHPSRQEISVKTHHQHQVLCHQALHKHVDCGFRMRWLCGWKLEWRGRTHVQVVAIPGDAINMHSVSHSSPQTSCLTHAQTSYAPCRLEGQMLLSR